MGRFARYEFVQKIAVGGMAEVWSACGVAADGSTTDVVVKRILPEFASDESFQNMLLEEAEVTARLQHPNIVQVYDWGHLDETCFLAMERVVGLDGRQLLDASAMRRAPIPPAVALFAMGEIYKGLDYAHKRVDERGRPLGIVHRDVSPSNVLLSVTGEVKLSDFGIARAKTRSSHTVAGQVRGKPRYMSPEQAKGEELDGRSDLFAAGLVLHEFLTGKPVFPSANYLEEVVEIIEKGLPAPSHVNPAVPPELDSLVLALCERDVNERFQSGAGAYEAIVEWAFKRKMRLHGGVVAELVTSIVRPTQTKKPAQAKGETRIVRLDDAAGVSRFTTQGKMLNPDLMLPPVAPAASPSGARQAPAASASGLRAAPAASPSGVRKAPTRQDDAPSSTRVMQIPTSSTDVPAVSELEMPELPPEDDGPTDRRIQRPSAAVGAISAPPPQAAPRTGTGGGAGTTAAVAVAVLGVIALAVWWVFPRATVLTGVDDGDPVPTLELSFDAGAAARDTPAALDPTPEPSFTPARTPTPVTTRRARATPSATPKATATETPAAAVAIGPGFLTLRSKPSGEVTIDGQWAGSTPLAKHQLPSGEHTVVVNSDDGRSATEKVTILAGELTTLTLKLE